MSYVYSVRCNFLRPDLEQAWNDWYNTPKRKQMLAKPLFLTGQRFEAAALNTARKYLALWTVESPGAFDTPEYKSDWGFSEWAPHITDWSRDLYRENEPKDWDVGGDQALYLISFEDLSMEEAARERDGIKDRPDVTWMEAVGLDKHSPILGLQRVPLDWRPKPLPAGRFQETIFRPLTDCGRSR